MGMKDANLALSLFLPQVAAPCIPPSSHELVVSDSPFLPRQLTLLSFLSSCCSLPCLQACSVAPSCSTLCDPVDCSPPGSSVPRILQARILVWAAMPSSWRYSQPRVQTRVSYLTGRLFTTESPGNALWSFGRTTIIANSKFHIYVLIYCIGVSLSNFYRKNTHMNGNW